MKNKKSLKTVGIIGVVYSEGEPESYIGVEADVYVNGKTAQTKLFDTGHPKTDYKAATKWLKSQDCKVLMHTSSYDDFICDGGKI